MRFDETVDILRKNGIAGAGGAGFPSYAKLSRKADTIILNCAECEPLFKQHRQLLEKYAFEIVSMLDELTETVGAKEFIVAVKKVYKKTVEATSAVLLDFPKGRIFLLDEIYPAGDEVITVYETTKKRVPPGGIPIDVGVIVYNVETVFNMYKAIKLSEPVMYKYVTVAGEVRNPMVIKAPIGMKFEELAGLCGGVTTENPVYINGGPMTGRLAFGSDVVTKTTNGVLVMPENHYIVQRRMQRTSVSIKRAMSTCCQCRTCTDLCPRNLLGHPIEPHAFMAAAAQRTGILSKVMLNTQYCSSCGLCEFYSCPQGLRPGSLVTEYKAGLKANGIKFEKKEKWDNVNPLREYRKVPEQRLKSRLGITKYDKDAPLFEGDFSVKTLRVLLGQSIGASAVAAVTKGQEVKRGSILGKAKENALSLPVFSPCDGIVMSVTEKAVTIKVK